MRDTRDPLERRQFWPRPGKPEALGEIDFDQPCGNCGYNLRGLPPGVACPECGSRFGWNVGEEPIPWEANEHAPISFLRTVFLAIVRPHELARQVWRPGRLKLSAAKRFRRIALWVAIPPLCVIAWIITAHATDIATASWSLPITAAAIVLWLNTVTLEPIAFFKDKVTTKLLPRVETIAYYATAPLLLVPFHMAVLLVTLRPTTSGATIHFAIIAGEHIALLLVTMALGISVIAWLMYETVNITAVGAFSMVFGRAVTAIATAVVMLLGIPALAAAVVEKIVGSS